MYSKYFFPEKMSRMMKDMRPALDYSEEARKLWSKLGINPEEIDPSGYKPLDIIFKSEKGGSIYVGGERAVRDMDLLMQYGICAIVNCTTDIRNYHEKVLVYHNFDIASWRFHLSSKQDNVLQLISPVLQFINKQINMGGNVLVHCLAGAHRCDDLERDDTGKFYLY
ncbi:uncharacterized protein LOC111700046 isoform X2 [Eurytemora carolleeae]|uniref:uncharacterized protein LOC111700046 isoform X2 n=1 Tax=Eurytemora carolleeae TaxID=1294199 RepID=UPI000C78487F|nr:uncharacterized protein LOC111700046 isoform X2 [Eurytemora carolleeae]|eukprot:XP_023326632.1 uncharacterized protein LOC111700046 isoform X2 [Eurytemora affinis]